MDIAASNQERTMLPSFIIIGAQKCGTSALHFYLSQHPAILMSRPKELDYFCNEAHYARGVAWYSAHFDRWAPVIGEASPNYTNHPRTQAVPKRIHNLIPDVKLIYSVRDPVDRTIAGYLNRYAAGAEHRTLIGALSDFEDNSYVERSMYHMQFTQYLQWFPMKQALVLDADLMRLRTREVMAKVFEFLGVAPEFYSRRFEMKIHETKHKRRLKRAGSWPSVFGRRLQRIPGIGFRLHRLWLRPFSEPIPPPDVPRELRERLQRHLRDDAASFRALTGLKFPSWSV